MAAATSHKDKKLLLPTLVIQITNFSARLETDVLRLKLHL